MEIKNRELISDSSLSDMLGGNLSPAVREAFEDNQNALERLLEGEECAEEKA